MDQSEEKPRHPLTGEPYNEEEERTKLIQIDEVSKFSKEMQSDFQRFVDKQLVPQIAYTNFDQRSVPQDFFFAREVRPMLEPANIMRVYYKRDERAPVYKFRPAHELTFEKIPNLKGRVTSFYIHSVGEEFNAPYAELDSFTVSCDVSLSRGECIEIQSKINSRVLRVKYWKGGEINIVEINSDLRRYHSDDFAISSDKFEDVKQRKSSEIIEARGAEFEIRYNEKRDSIEFRRTIDGKKTDFVSIPMSVDLEQIQRSVLTGQLIDNPVNADLNEDDRWKALTLKDFGINWQRS